MKKIYFVIIIILFNFIIYSASVNVDEMKLIADTHYNINTQSMENTTYFNFITTLDGGYKFSSQIAFEGNTTDIENQLLNSTFNFNTVFLILRKAEIDARNLADSHLDLSLWTGIDKYLGAGAIYKGYLYYPETQDVDYVGYYRLKGTGITAQLKFWDDRFRANFHFYENTNFITKNTPNVFYMFSFDSEVGLYFDQIPYQNDNFHLMIQLSGGATFPKADIGEYKVGLSFGIGNNYIDFFISGGLPKIDSNAANLTFDDFFISSYLHFKLALTDNTISFLTRPLWYNEQLSGINNPGEKSDFDVNYKFKILIPSTPVGVGANLLFQYSLTVPSDPWKLILAQFLDITYSGINWNVAINYDFSRIYIGNLNQDSRIYLEGLRIIVGASAKF